jgi:ubiquinone biosynthesis protein
MVGRIDEPTRNQIEDILVAAGDQDADRLTDNVLRITRTPEHFDRKSLSADLSDLFEEYGNQAVGEFDVGGMLRQVTDILHNHKLILPSKISMLIKCLILLEGTGRLLNPSFSLAGLLAPWRNELMRRRYSLKARFKKLRLMYGDWERLAQSIPRVIFNAMERVEEGHFAIRLEHRNLKTVVNRLVGGVFVSALLLASALLIGHNVPPVAWKVSIPGAAGYAVALFFGAHLLWKYRDKANIDDE